MSAEKLPKILHIITRLDWGGSSVNTLLGAKLAGYETKIVTGSVSSGTAPQGIILLPEMGREISPLKDLKAFLKLCAIIRAERPDIVHTHASKAGILGRWAAFACRLAGVKAKVIHTPHGHVFYGYFTKTRENIFIFAERLTVYITGTFIALTAGEMRESEKYLPASRGKWLVIHSGIEFGPEYAELNNPANRAATRAKIRAQLGIGEYAFVIGTAARLEPVKGIEYLVRMAASLRRDSGGLCFLVVGEGGQGEYLRALV